MHLWCSLGLWSSSDYLYCHQLLSSIGAIHFLVRQFYCTLYEYYPYICIWSRLCLSAFQSFFMNNWVFPWNVAIHLVSCIVMSFLRSSWSAGKNKIVLYVQITTIYSCDYSFAVGLTMSWCFRYRFCAFLRQGIWDIDAVISWYNQADPRAYQYIKTLLTILLNSLYSFCLTVVYENFFWVKFHDIIDLHLDIFLLYQRLSIFIL